MPPKKIKVRAPVVTPSETALVRTLPGELTEAGRIWWNPDVGENFLKQNKTPGNPDGKKGFARDRFVKYWWADNMPGVDISDNDKRWYFDNTDIGTVSCVLFRNCYVTQLGAKRC